MDSRAKVKEFVALGIRSISRRAKGLGLFREGAEVPHTRRRRCPTFLADWSTILPSYLYLSRWPISLLAGFKKSTLMSNSLHIEFSTLMVPPSFMRSSRAILVVLNWSTPLHAYLSTYLTAAQRNLDISVRVVSKPSDCKASPNGC